MTCLPPPARLQDVQDTQDAADLGDLRHGILPNGLCHGPSPPGAQVLALTDDTPDTCRAGDDTERTQVPTTRPRPGGNGSSADYPVSGNRR